ncbi:MAG TPA: hypothetical protein VMT51_11120 [Dongiaceae bacterium]|nr:hypothetical protein [Dongiaceae bacterium]
MIFGMTPLTFIHVLLSLVGIASGFIVILGLIGGRSLRGVAGLFLATTILTSATGFLFPVHKLLPSHIVGIISLVFLAIAVVAFYPKQLQGGWRRTYAITAVLAQYLNVFVLVAQLFMKVPALKALAPTQSEGPFKMAQLAVLLLFLILGVLAARRFNSAHSIT